MEKRVSSVHVENKQTVVLEDTVVRGDINLSAGLCLFGKILGNIMAEGYVKVMENAVVTGNVRCRELYVAGSVEGDVVTCTLRLGENAVLRGKVEASKLCLDGENYDMKQFRLVKK